VRSRCGAGVAPPAGAWIETPQERQEILDLLVAPPAGAWIETERRQLIDTYYKVAPPAGAWIETAARVLYSLRSKSLPPRERGLKRLYDPALMLVSRRSPRGSVD